jgi:DNA integrity scanning protein DisA with diadenylate cyclase activity
VFEGISTYLETRTFLHFLRDAFDIFLVYYLVYRALLVLRGTRAMQVGLGDDAQNPSNVHRGNSD